MMQVFLRAVNIYSVDQWRNIDIMAVQIIELEAKIIQLLVGALNFDCFEIVCRLCSHAQLDLIEKSTFAH